MSDLPGHPTALFRAEGLAFSHPGLPLFDGLSFAIAPGLTLVRGGDGRGKTTLLRLVAGTLQPAAGVLQRQGETLYFDDPAAAAADAVEARAWLDARRERFAGWRGDVASALVEAFGLAPHVGKPMFMLSTGSRRKVGLVAAAASGARLTLVDQPFAALDRPSREVLAQLLAEAAAGAERAWVIADHQAPAELAGVPLSGLVDLGD